MRLALLLAVSILLQGASLACDPPTPCEQCAKDSEMSWNPDEKLATDRLRRFYVLGDLVAAAYQAADAGATLILANEYLQLSKVYRCNWNHGNAVHEANRYLGLVILRSGNADAAADHLVQAGKSSGSPQLNTVGPDLDLANALLQLGKVDAVKLYLRDIKSFWRVGERQVDRWLSDIEKGGRPELNRLSAVEPPGWLVAAIWLSLSWPIIVSLGILYWLRTRLARKWLFLASAVAAGYLAMLAANLTVGSVAPGIGIAGTALAGLATPLLAIYLVSRLFIAKKAG
jgi:hypothetical protein